MNIISINNLDFKYSDKIIFSKFKLKIKQNTITTVIGKNGSGKTTLVKILAGLLQNDGKVKYKDNSFDKKVLNKIGVVFENLDNQLIGKTVMEQLILKLENINYNKKNIKKRLNEVVNRLDLKNVVNKNINDLNNNQKQIVNLALALINNPEVLILDNLFIYLDPNEKGKISNLLVELKESGLTIINFTQDIEDTLISDEIVVIDNGKVILKGNKENVYKEEKKLNNLGFKLPFMVELSNRLKFYDLIDENIYDMQKMVDTLWK